VRDEPRQKRPPISWSIASTVLLAAAAIALAGAAPAVRGAQAQTQYAQSIFSAPAQQAEQAQPKRPSRPNPSPVAQEPKTKLVEFENAPFPFDSGADPRKRRTASLDNEKYSDPRVLLHIPQGFDIRKPGVIVIFFHGHRANLSRDVLARQRVAEQISLSKANAVVVAPQFAVNASDSSAGNFWTPGLFTLFLNEASEQLAILHGFLGLARDFDKLNVVIVGYSGGFAPVAWAIHHGGSNERMRGVVLLDALYGEVDKFEKWITGDRYRRFFVSGYLGSTRARNLQLQQMLDNRGIKYRMALDDRIRPGSITFLPGRNGENHHSYVTKAWTDNPLADILNRLPEYRR
jgi:hypothetical protein